MIPSPNDSTPSSARARLNAPRYMESISSIFFTAYPGIWFSSRSAALGRSITYERSCGKLVGMPATKQRSTRAAILDRAVDLASEEGLEGLTIGRLAAEMEMSKSGLFGHF